MVKKAREENKFVEQSPMADELKDNLQSQEYSLFQFFTKFDDKA